MNVTIEKNFKILRSFLKWAKENGYNKNTEFETFRPKFDGMRNKDRMVIALDWQELMTVYHLDIPASKNYLSQVRDVFCFQCFTGLRFSDVYNLTRANIKNGRIEYVTQKTNDPLSVPLNDYSQAILDKYVQVAFEGNKALPVISNQRTNDYLKELGQMAGLTGEETVIHYIGTWKVTQTMPKYEILTTHVGRRTFVSIGSYLNIPYEIMASWTGHSSETMMAKYRAINSGKAKSEMNKINYGNVMSERDKELARYFNVILHTYNYGNYMYRGLIKWCDDENIERYYSNLEEALRWGLIHGKCEQHGDIGFRYQSPNHSTHRVLDDRNIEHIERQIQKAKEMALEEEMQKKAATPIRDMNAIKKELLAQFVKESQQDELSNLFSYGRVYRHRIEWKGGYRELQEKIRPLFEDESIPHLHSKEWIHFAVNNFTKNGKDLSEKSLRNEMTRENWAY